MGVSKIVFVSLLVWSTQKCDSTDPGVIINKITGFVRNEAEVVHDKLKEAANAVHDLFHPHRHLGGVETHPSGEGPAYPHQPTGGVASGTHYPSTHGSYPDYSSGQGSLTPNYPTSQGSHINSYPTGHESSHSRHPIGQGTFHPNRQTEQRYPNYNNIRQNSNYPESSKGFENTNSNKPTGEGYYYSENSLGQGYPDEKNTIEQGSNYPGYSKAQDHNYPSRQGSQTGSSSSAVEMPFLTTNNKPTYNVDVRNSETGTVSSTETTTGHQDGRSLLAFKGCPDGERKDRAGKCRPVT